MKKLAISTAAALTALAAVCAWGGWVYEGQWGKTGYGDGEFISPDGVDVAPNGWVYVADWRGSYLGNEEIDLVQYFTPTGSFLGKWKGRGQGAEPEFVCLRDVSVAPNSNVYIVEYGSGDDLIVEYYSPTGSYLGGWGRWGHGVGEFLFPDSIAVAPGGNVYVADSDNHRVQYFTSGGFFIGKWGTRGSGDGEFLYTAGVGIAPNGNVYVVDYRNYRIQYFTASGGFLGKWGSRGSGEGQFVDPEDVAVAPDGSVYVSDTGNHRIQYFTATGSFLGVVGSYGSGNGEFDRPQDMAFSPAGDRLYVADGGDNDRIQYFRRSPAAVAPTSLGRVKALFR